MKKTSDTTTTKPEESGETNIPIGCTAPIDRVIPKYCTGVQVALLQGGAIVISMMYSESQDSHALIDRVVLNPGHAAKLGKILTEAAAKAEEEQKNDRAVHD